MKYIARRIIVDGAQAGNGPVLMQLWIGGRTYEISKDLFKDLFEELPENETGLKPITNRVVIKVDPQQDEKYGILLADAAKEKSTTGIVVAVGPGLKDEPMQLKIGDRVHYGKFQGVEIKVRGNEYTVIRETDVFLSE